MDASEVIELATESGIATEDRESLVAFTLGFAAGSVGGDSAECVHLYGLADTLATIGVLAFMEDAGVPYKFHVVNPHLKQTRSPDFLAINPYGTIPTIRHGPHALHETNAIYVYVCRAFPTITAPYYGNGDIHLQSIIDSALCERVIALDKVAMPTVAAGLGYA